MSAITATLDVGEDMTDVVTNLLRRFPKGARVKVAISEVVVEERAPTLEEYRERIAKAREWAPKSPWRTTAEAMKVLREGEGD
jgi:hypothetical protein